MSTKKTICYKVSAVLAMAVLIWFDQWTKIMARGKLKGNPVVILKDIFELRYVENRGAVWGLAQGSVIPLIVISIVIFFAILYVYIRVPLNKHYLPLNILSVFIMSGAIGNLIDRIGMNYVTDFFYIKLIDFPVFNVADIYVTFSAIIVLLLAFTLYRNDEWEFLAFSKKKEISEQ